MKTIISNQLESKKRSLFSSTCDYINQFRWDYFVTLNFNHTVNHQEAQQILRRFIKILNNRIFGCRSNKAINLIPSIEPHHTDGVHIHLLMEDPCHRMTKYQQARAICLSDAVRSAWESSDPSTAWISKSCPDGKSWFKPITETPWVLGGYLSKTLRYGYNDAVQWDMMITNGRRIAHL